MSINELFERSLEDCVLKQIEPTKPYTIPDSDYPLCPDCKSPSGSRTSSRGQQEYTCKNPECRRNFSESTKNQPRKKINHPPCPDCGSFKVHKKGIFKKTGEIKYRCYECLRSFRQSQINIKSRLVKDKNIGIELKYEMPICPSCGGQDLQKKGFETHKSGKKLQKYQCKACQSGFVESASNRPACPNCKVNSWIRKQGIDKNDEKPRFFCVKCSRSFKLNIKPPCPDCNSLWIRKKGICPKTKQQKYYCVDCSRLYTESTKNQPKEIYPPCPECDSKEVKKHGQTIVGGRRYRCNSCQEFFFDYRNSPACPDCKQNKKVIRTGKDKQLNGEVVQKYLCKPCNRRFTELTKDIKKKSPKLFQMSFDSWDLRAMGVYFPPSCRWFTADFRTIKFEWLRNASKSYIKHLTAIESAGTTCLKKLYCLKTFSCFLETNYPNISSLEINRNVVVDYFAYLKIKYNDPKSIDTRRNYIKNLDNFLRKSHQFQWLKLLNPVLIYPEDLPKGKKGGKTFHQIIPDEVLEQLLDNLDGLPIVFSRMAFLMMGAPIRVSEACGMRFDCIKQDKDGDWWLHFWDFKLNKEHNPIPIRKEVADVIKTQQQFIRQKLGNDYEYLFCAKTTCPRKDGTYRYTNRPPSSSSFRQALRKLVRDRNITSQGKLYLELSKTHQFRHTGASDLINKGMPLVMIQEILGHESPEMTMVYAKLYDDTLKETWKEVAPKIVDITGKITKVEREKLDAPKYQEMKRIALEQQVNNGTCGLSVHQKCPKFHACYTCSKFKATPENLSGLKNDREQLKNEVKQLKKQLDLYKQKNKLRLVEGCRDRINQSREIIKNLDKMITSLESNQAS